MSPRPEAPPLFEVKLELLDNSIDLVPPFRDERGGICKVVEGWVGDILQGICKVVEGWVGDILKSAATTTRLDSGKGDYVGDVKESYSFMTEAEMYGFHLRAGRARLTELLEMTEDRVNSYLAETRRYEFLWKRDPAKDLESFIAESPPEVFPSTEDEGDTLENVLELVGVDLGRRVPELSCFDEKICFFESLRSEIAELKTPVDVCWLRINAQPAKVQLSQLAASWAAHYTDFLLNCCLARADALTQFVNRMDTCLSVKPPTAETEEEEAGEAQAAASSDSATHSQPAQQTDTEPEAKDAIDKDTLYKFMTYIRDVKIANDPIKRLLGPVHEQVALLKKHGCLVPEARLQALDAAPSKWEEVMRKAFEAKEAILPLQNAEEAWDVSVYVSSWFEAWKATLWETIDTELLLQHVKAMQQHIRGLSKEIKSTKVYAAVLERVNNMQVVLPLVSELHSEFMRDRHWKQLMNIAGQTFTIGPGFCLEDLLRLNLHERAADVSEIVVCAQKEARIDKKLREITKTWATKTVEFSLERDDTPLLQPLDEIVEVLEQHSVDLMTMTSQGAVIDFCRPAVEEWQAKLRTVDTVLTVWMEVQRKWERLQPIFMHSEDIRSQLPQESKRFECADGEWRDMMYAAQAHPNVVEACQAEGREDLLNKLRDSIESCEKALGGKQS
ncbi:Flagellar outer dynein arm heavy chain beta, related [Eimeria praecox]|uniref:Flagellar outer dynein arm heavy chain beta, related n=1 Tax=Eimeria praecox TaxID=51316 RepID=U6GWX7_9EIME|nr:Flagellar outer dynein arm heavy chain beta, related [Eimeria praecox]